MTFVVDLAGVDRADTRLVGGKAGQLGELSRIDGIVVPDGFCVTTEAFQLVVTGPSIDDRLDRLSRTAPQDGAALRRLGTQLRQAIDAVAVPEPVVAAIRGSLDRLGAGTAVAVRSSATAEDLPGSSFAGQHDSFLDVVGLRAVLEHIRRCWASLFSERAVSYRRRNGFDERTVRMAVVVQRMVSADAAGVLFTADPVTSNRRTVTVEAARGLGEALVSGLVIGDAYRVGPDGVVDATVERGTGRVLSDAQVTHLVALGRRIEAHFGRPQDIEWCLADGAVQFVQSRPITTLFPVPRTDDDDNHVYVSVGHQQMMTDAMRPLGLSFWQHTTLRPMHEAGGRLFVDVAPILATAAGRASILGSLGRSDPLIRDALQTILDRGTFVPLRPDDDSDVRVAPTPDQSLDLPTDPGIVTGLIERSRTSVAALELEITRLRGPALVAFITTDLAELKRILFDPTSRQVIMAGMGATWWLDDHLESWLGDKDATGTLLRSVPHNVTSEMGLALLDVADVLRSHPEVVAFLERVVADGREGDRFLDELPALSGGSVAREAIRGFLAAYGMRCAGEIDITRTRWSESPTTLVPAILSNVRSFEPGEGVRRLEAGLRAARRKEHELLERLRALPDGEHKADETERMIDRVRTYAGYREYPKYGMICRYFVYKQALTREAERMVQAGVLSAPDDIWYLRLDELSAVVSSGVADHDLIRRRRDAFGTYETLTPPRVLTSDGEVVSGDYRGVDAPADAMVGLAVSSGVVEGRARVVSDLARADLTPGDILVTAYTDPSWTPVFLTAAGLVTEVGGLMTHGAVIAREYGLPAVVGVQRATRVIRDGQRIRVNGSAGYVELLD